MELPRRLRSAGGLLLLLSLLPAEIRSHAEEVAKPRLHLLTFMNKMDRRYAFLQVSAEAQHLYPQVLGYGTRAWHPDGLGVKINKLRTFVYHSVADQDIVVFADAFDVLILGDEQEITKKFERLEEKHGRHLVFNAEQQCYPDVDGVCNKDTYPSAPHRWRFLNSGLMVGRGYAFKAMLKNPVPNVIRGSDQAWYQKYRREHPEVILLDYECEMLCALWALGGREAGAELRDGRIYVNDTGTMPPLVHFVSIAHWTRWADGVASTLLHDTFKKIFPAEAARLLDDWTLILNIGTTHVISLYEGSGWWVTMFTSLCVKCNLLGSTEGECHYFPGLGTCLLINIAVLLLFGSLAFCAWSRFRGGDAEMTSMGALRSPPGLQTSVRRFLRKWGQAPKAPEVLV